MKPERVHEKSFISNVHWRRGARQVVGWDEVCTLWGLGTQYSDLCNAGAGAVHAMRLASDPRAAQRGEARSVWAVRTYVTVGTAIISSGRPYPGIVLV